MWSGRFFPRKRKRTSLQPPAIKTISSAEHGCIGRPRPRQPNRRPRGRITFVSKNSVTRFSSSLDWKSGWKAKPLPLFSSDPRQTWFRSRETDPSPWYGIWSIPCQRTCSSPEEWCDNLGNVKLDHDCRTAEFMVWFLSWQHPTDEMLAGSGDQCL